MMYDVCISVGLVVQVLLSIELCHFALSSTLRSLRRR